MIATGTVSGKFLAGGKEKGTIKSIEPTAKSCNGRFTYSAKAVESQ